MQFLSHARSFWVDYRGRISWRLHGWDVPASPPAKRAVLKRYSLPDATWVETGTYRGDTTAFLANLSASAISLEPDDALFEKVRIRFAKEARIKILHGTSEALFAQVVENLQGPACFWLDGHYSGPGTHQSLTKTPISHELAVIAANLEELLPVVVLVDDFREFPADAIGKADSEYPTKGFLVKWAQENNLCWTVEHDIFIAYSELR